MAERRNQSTGEHVSSEFTDVAKWMTMLGHLEKRAGDAAQQLEETGADTGVVQEVYDIANVCGLLSEKLDRFAVSNLLVRRAA